jgi:HEAT repeat protein
MKLRKSPEVGDKRPDAELLDELTAACVRRGHAFDCGNVKRANAEFDRATQVARELLSRGHSATDGILTLLSHENPFVRLEAAFLALEIEPERGEEVLEELGRSYTDLNIGFTSRFTLKQWRAGKLKTLSERPSAEK